MVRCPCGGNLYVESHDEEDVGHISFTGFAVKCLLCSRTIGYLSIAQLMLLMDMPEHEVRRARFATMGFLSQRDE